MLLPFFSTKLRQTTAIMVPSSQVRGLKRVQRSSNLFVDTMSRENTPPLPTVPIELVSPALQNPYPSSLLPSQPTSTSIGYLATTQNPSSLLPSQTSSASFGYPTTPQIPSEMKMNHQYPHLGPGSVGAGSQGQIFLPEQHRYATIIDGAVYGATGASETAHHVAASAPTTPCCLRFRRPSLSSVRSIASFWLPKRRPSISSPTHPRLVSSVADPQVMEQFLVRYTSLTHEGQEFARQPLVASIQAKSRHDVETPDPLRCHPAQHGATDDEPTPSSPATNPGNYTSTVQHLTSSQRWQRAYN